MNLNPSYLYMLQYARKAHKYLNNLINANIPQTFRFAIANINYMPPHYDFQHEFICIFIKNRRYYTYCILSLVGDKL